MSEEKLLCPKCKGEMVRGFIAEYSEQGTMVEGWHEGEPQVSFWMGIKAPRREIIPIGVFRCKSCGFLECYADNKFAAK